jgi:phosphate:Na+ symporter
MLKANQLNYFQSLRYHFCLLALTPHTIADYRLFYISDPLIALVLFSTIINLGSIIISSLLDKFIHFLELFKESDGAVTALLLCHYS